MNDSLNCKVVLRELGTLIFADSPLLSLNQTLIDQGIYMNYRWATSAEPAKNDALGRIRSVVTELRDRTRPRVG